MTSNAAACAFAPDAREFGDDFLDLGRVPPVDDHRRPRAGEAARQREADARGRAGDQRDGLRKPEQTLDQLCHGRFFPAFDRPLAEAAPLQ